MTIEEEIEQFNNLTETMKSTFAKKRADYGQTTTETFEKFGPVSFLTRMHDKLGRLDNICINKRIEVKEENVKDTLFDLANYCLIMILEIDKQSLQKYGYQSCENKKQ